MPTSLRRVLYGGTALLFLFGFAISLSAQDDAKTKTAKTKSAKIKVKRSKSTTIRALPLTKPKSVNKVKVTVDKKNVDAKDGSKEESTKELLPTHKQTRIFQPQVAGKAATLSTFRVDPSGQIVAGVSAVEIEKLETEKTGKKPTSKAVGYLQVYSPEFKLVNEIRLPFVPSALDLGKKNGEIYVAGGGKLLHLSQDGKVLGQSESPNMIGVDLDELREEIKADLKAQSEELKKVYQSQLEIFEKQIAIIEKIKEEDRSDIEKLKLKNFTAQKEAYENILKQRDQIIQMSDASIDARLKMATRITALAATEEDLFVSTSARSGSGYEVHRMTLDMKEPKRVLNRLRGCCGQMDIHAVGDQIYVAENTKFQVGIYSRDGKPVTQFGERFKNGNQGFGSCCNPMNVFCCDNGDIITAESSIGKLKKFNQKGELIGYVGRARIGGGCKHVAFGHDKRHDRYYVQYEDKNYICVLTKFDPTKKAAVDPKVAEHTKKLTAGKWIFDESDMANSKKSDDAKDSLSQTYSYLTNMKSLEFLPDGTTKTQLADSRYARNDEGYKWVPTKFEGKTLYLDLETKDSVITYRIKIIFEDDRNAKISVTYDGLGQDGAFRPFKREKQKKSITFSTENK